MEMRMDKYNFNELVCTERYEVENIFDIDCNEDEKIYVNRETSNNLFISRPKVQVSFYVYDVGYLDEKDCFRLYIPFNYAAIFNESKLSYKLVKING